MIMINLAVVAMCTATLPSYIPDDRTNCMIEARECISTHTIYKQNEIAVVEACAKIIAEKFDDGVEWCR